MLPTLKHGIESIKEVIRKWNDGKDMPLPTNGREKLYYDSQILYADMYLRILDKNSRR